jgi:GNAT superfamily N-acetyltransferase
VKRVAMDDYTWRSDTSTVDWDELTELYRIAPFGSKSPEALRTVFGNSMFVRFAYADDVLVGAGRALADGLDCAYIADLAVHPEHQGHGLGKALIHELLTAAKEHKKIILYARPGTEGFYASVGFLPMTTAMAIFQDRERALRIGLVNEGLDPKD